MCRYFPASSENQSTIPEGAEKWDPELVATTRPAGAALSWGRSRNVKVKATRWFTAIWSSTPSAERLFSAFHPRPPALFHKTPDRHQGREPWLEPGVPALRPISKRKTLQSRLQNRPSERLCARNPEHRFPELSGVIIKRQRGHDKTTRGGTLRKHYQSGVGTLSRPAGWSGLRPSFL